MMDYDMHRELVDKERNEYLVTDSEGNFSRYVAFGGFNWHTEPESSGTIEGRLKQLENFQWRDDDIMLLMYPKSGTHWILNIVAMISSGKLEYVPTSPPLDSEKSDVIKYFPSPRVLSSHSPFKFLPSGIKEGKTKIITVYRDPRDVMVSYYTYMMNLYRETTVYRGTWNGFFKFYLSKEVWAATWFDHIKMWESAMKEYPEKEILFLSYENMKKNLYDNVAKVAQFLGVERSESFLQEVTSKCSFATMKTDAYKDKGPNLAFDTLCKNGHLPIYRKGKIGDWKNWFTVAQSEMFDAFYEREMKDHDISLIYTYSK